jgi:hypothetical protein
VRYRNRWENLYRADRVFKLYNCTGNTEKFCASVLAAYHNCKGTYWWLWYLTICQSKLCNLQLRYFINIMNSRRTLTKVGRPSVRVTFTATYMAVGSRRFGAAIVYCLYNRCIYLSVVYSRRYFSNQDSIGSNEGAIVNDELESIWNETVLA